MGMIKVTNKLEAFLTLHNWDYKILAKECGCDESFISGILNGSREPSKQLIRKICDTTRMDIGDLFTYDRTAEPKEDNDK
jgi:transcriptional regulator with XRE-family HTH domain